MKPFRSFSNIELVNQPEQPPTREEMAADLAEETCLRYKSLRAEALAAEQNADAPVMESAEQRECLTTLGALLKGRHRWVVVPVVLEHLPELVRPPTEAEKAEAERYLAANPQVDLRPV